MTDERPKTEAETEPNTIGPDNIESDKIEADDDIIDVEVIETVSQNQNNTAAPSSKASQSKKTTPWGWITALILAAFIGGLFSAQYAKEGLITLGLLEPETTVISNPANPEIETKINALQADTERLTNFSGQHETILNALSAKQTEIENALQNLPASTATELQPIDTEALDAIKNDITRLSENLTRLAAIKNDSDPALTRLESAVTVTNAETAALKQQIDDLQSALNTIASGALETSPRGRLILLLTRMKEKAQAGLTFKSDIQALRVDLSTLPALDQQVVGSEISKLETTGGLITPYDILLRDFDAVASAAAQAQDKSEGSFLTNLFTVRQRGTNAQGIDAILFQAEKRLLSRDIDGAAALMNELDTPAKDAASIWIENAKQHTDTLKVLDAIIFRISRNQTPSQGAGQ